MELVLSSSLRALDVFGFCSIPQLLVQLPGFLESEKKFALCSIFPELNVEILLENYREEGTNTSDERKVFSFKAAKARKGPT